MGKPDDIPQSVWDVAKVLVFGEYFTESAGIAEVARAILAAKAEEREACAVIADINGKWPDESSPYWSGSNKASALIAAAIRKRGEA